jgi:hypothetical protein
VSVEWDRWQSSATGQPDANENRYWLRLNWHAVHRPGHEAVGAPAVETEAPPPPGS